MYFWTTIRKNRSKYNLTRGISEDDVTKILLDDVIVAKDPQKAETSLLKLPGLRKFLERLRTDREKEDFRRHMRKYINLWLPDCPFEVSTTNRYTIVTQEAATIARRFIKKGETIKYLCGNLVAITSEEEKDLDLTRRDFSIVMSSRKKRPSLFLGPARFANHDCDANARLVTRGSEGMQVVSIKDIEIDDEITVTYGDDYFGVNNCECLCKTCEINGRNGWSEGNAGSHMSGSPSGIATPSVEEVDSTSGPYSFRRKRKYMSSGDLTPTSMTPEIEETRLAKRRKLDMSSSFPTVESTVPDVHYTYTSVKKASPGSGLKREILLSDQEIPSAKVDLSEDRTPKPQKADSGESSVILSVENLDSQLRVAFMSSLSQSPDYGLDSASHGSMDDALPTFDITSSNTKSLMPSLSFTPPVDRAMDSITQEIPITPIKIKTEDTPSSALFSDADSIFSNEIAPNSSPATTPSAISEPTCDHSSRSPDPAYLSDTTLSELSENESLDDFNMTIIRKPRKRKPKSSFHHLLPSVEIPTIRISGDYIRTPLLLGEAFSRWVNCKTCPAVWVQQNGYYTRKECPRCERHSKLYGYQWPKTDKIKGDDEERVMDHRTVHRFLKPEDEKAVRKRGRGLDEVGERCRSESERGRSESARDEVGETGYRSSKRRKRIEHIEME